MPTRWTLATAAVAYCYLVLVVRGNPCDWDFTISGESSAYASSTILQPNGLSFSATEGSCLCEESTSCEYDTTPNTGHLFFHVDQTTGWEVVYLDYGTEGIALPPGPSVMKIGDEGYFEVGPIPGPTFNVLYEEPEYHALCTKAECLFAHAVSLVNGVGCVGMAGHVEITIMNDELISVGRAEYDFKCSAGTLPTCQTNCAVTRNYEGITQIVTHPHTITIWETEEGQICYDAEFEKSDWYDDNPEFNVEGAFLFPWAYGEDGSLYVEGGTCSRRPDYRVSRILVSTVAVRVQLVCLVSTLVLCGSLCCCYCTCCAGGDASYVFRVFGWAVSGFDTVCEVSAIVAMLSSIWNCGANEFCSDSFTVAITCIAVGQAVPTLISVIVFVRETFGKRRSRPIAIGKSMKYLLMITDPNDNSMMRVVIAVMVPSVFAVIAYAFTGNLVWMALPGALAVLVGACSMCLVKRDTELTGLIATYLLVDWMTVVNTLGLPSADGDISWWLAIASKTVSLIFVFVGEYSKNSSCVGWFST